MKKEVLIVSCVYPPEPVVSAQLSNDIAEKLSEEHRVTIYCPRPTRPYGYSFIEKERKSSTIKIVESDSFVFPQKGVIGRLIESISFGIATKKFIKKNKDKISLIYINTWPIFGQYFAIKESKKFNIPSVLHIQDVYPESFTQKAGKIGNIVEKILLYFENFNINKVNKIIVISQSMKSFYVNNRKLNSEKIEVVYNWSKLSQHKLLKEKNYNLSGRSTKILYLGSISTLANLDFVIRTFSLIKNNNVNLVIAGEGVEKKNLISYVNTNKIANVNFVDAPMEKVSELQSEADILILPLKKGAAQFALPSKLQAYMKSARPILAVVDKESDISLIINESLCGWVVEPDNENELINKINEITSLSKKELLLIGQKGSIYAEKHFNGDKNVIKIMSIFNSYLRD